MKLYNLSIRLFNILGYYDENGVWHSSLPSTTTEGCSDDLKVIFKFIHLILGLIQIVVPIILIIVGAFDLAKAVMGSDEKEIKAATQKLIKRAIAAVSVFFIGTAVSIVMNYVAQADEKKETNQSWSACWKATQ